MQNDVDIILNYSEFLRACEVEEKWVSELVAEDVITVSGSLNHAQFSGWQVARVRRAHRLHRDFSASAAAVALILDLLDEVETLRKQQR